MNDYGAIARELALTCEAKKHAYRQTQDGVVVSFVLHPQEVPDGLATAALGTRYSLVLVEIDEDETPKRKEAPTQNTHAKPAPASDPHPARVHKSWDELPATQQAAIRCNEVAFQRFLEETEPDAWRLMNLGTDAERAAEIVRYLCSVKSRKDIVPGTHAFQTWKILDDCYRTWMQVPA